MYPGKLTIIVLDKLKGEIKLVLKMNEREA
jgi:hypothetical protein